MRTPKRALALWGLANLAAIAVVPLYANWILRVTSIAASGAQWSTDADSPSVPIGQVTLLVAMALPILNLLLWVVLRGYPGSVTILPRLRLEGRFILIETVTIGLIGLFCFVVVDSAIAHDWEFLPLGLAWVYVVMSIRGVLHAKADRARSGVLQRA